MARSRAVAAALEKRAWVEANNSSVYWAESCTLGSPEAWPFAKKIELR